jgi:peptidoglycan/LPS O-acetylase OafA/YrhL
MLLVLLVIAIPRFEGTTAPRTLFQVFVLYTVLEAAIGGILIHVVQHPYRILNVAPIVWLGRISYSLYLWQQPFSNPASPTRYGILAAIGIACCSYYLIEQPILRYREGRVPAPSDTSTEVAAA